MTAANDSTTKFFLALNAFQAFAEDVFGLFNDSVHGWISLSQQMRELISSQMDRGKTPFQASRTVLIYGKGQPGLGGIPKHDSTLGETHDRCSPHGPNEQKLANLSAVAIYTHWDHVSRLAIAEAISIPVNNVQCDFLGDLRLIRHAILHKSASSIADLAKCGRLKWFAEGDAIQVHREHLFELIQLIRALPENLRHAGWQPGQG